ncbi:MAG: D-alanyl-D-alanine carboxypeptidase family protein [Clostridium sp.]|uniref:D-alanyl-D-alanine carboxypeptidase family protein n=1 Tax=Clostridium sp. TaxID=1506 RepID=UPI003F2C6968
MVIIGLNVMGKNSFALDKKLKVDGRCAIAIEKETGKVLFEQNAYEIVEMASTTKILTALVAIENADLEQKFTVSKKAASCRGSKVGYKANEEITVRELLYGLMYKSGNDAAITLAEGIGGTEEEFARIMNHYSSSLGLIDSHFQTPHGLDKEDHYSSAYDLAMLTSKAMDYKIFREIVGSKQIDKNRYKFTRDYNNINKILWQIEGANGVKTGYTGKAGKCLVSSVNKNGKDIIMVVLNCPKRWEETKKIYEKITETSAITKVPRLDDEEVVYAYNPGKKTSIIETYNY